MIQPISLKTTQTTILIEPHFSSFGDEINSKSVVETFVIDSGRLKGTVIAHVRYLPNTMDSDYPWQVIKQRNDTTRFHYSTVKTLEQALHLVMACAYEYVAFN